MFHRRDSQESLHKTPFMRTGGLTPAGTAMMQRRDSLESLKLPSIGKAAARNRLHPHRHDPFKTALTAQELAMAEDTWDLNVPRGFVDDYGELEEVLLLLQVPQQPVITNLIKEKFDETSHFSFMDFVSVLEQCKSIHIRWVHKIQGKTLDDDLLEAFVAVGGHEDSGGEVDLRQMKSVISQFELKVDLDRIVAEMDTDGDANIDFSEFADLLRGQAHKRTFATAEEVDVSDAVVGSPLSDEHRGGKPVLSTMEFFEADLELCDDGVMRQHQHPSFKEAATGSMRSRSMLFAGKSYMGAADGRLARQSSMKSTPKDRPIADTPQPGGTAPGKDSHKKLPRSQSTTPSTMLRKRGGRSQSPARLEPLAKKPRTKKPKFANW